MNNVVAFRLLGWHPGPAITPVVITAVADVPPAQGRRLLRELMDHNLLEQLSLAGVPGGPRYRMHDLVRLYARERANAEEPPTQHAAAVGRLADSYLAITRQADRLLRPHVTDGSAQGTTSRAVLTFTDASQARSWLTIERLNLLGCIRVMNPTSEAAGLATITAAHFCDFGFWSDVRYLYGQALTAYHHLGDQHGEVHALWGLGEVERCVGEYGQARTHYTQALVLARQLGYRRGKVDALWGLGQTERLVGEYGPAREYHTQALALAQQLGYRRGEADALRGLGEVERLVGEYGPAREYHTRALTLTQQLGDRRGEADALCGLGYIAADTVKRDQAYEAWRKALEIYQELAVPFAETIRTAMCQLDC
jgi:tetratricopeptide (TPR) repeat protein